MTDFSGKPGRKKSLLILLVVFGTLALAAWIHWSLWGQYEEETDDAYVQGYDLPVHPQVSGTLVSVLVDDTQQVHAGQIIARLDDAKATLNLEHLAEQYETLLGQVHEACAMIDRDRAVVRQRQVELDAAQGDWNRRKPLLHSPALASEARIHAFDALREAQATLAKARQDLHVDQVRAITCNPDKHPGLKQIRTDYALAYLDAERLIIRAPVDGMIARRQAVPGQHVSPDDVLMSVVPLRELWVDANLKENQLRNVRVGQPVQLYSDLYGHNVVFHGVVAGLSAGSGSAFSLLPPQNAVGNWIKVVQRLPVRIAMDPKEIQSHPLRIGLSMQVVIDTHDRSRHGSTPTLAPALLQTDIYAWQRQVAEKAAQAMVDKAGE